MLWIVHLLIKLMILPDQAVVYIFWTQINTLEQNR
jgi:hypothetical protein